MAAGKTKLVFAVNGERFELAKVEPSTTLLDFLRTRTRFTGPKLGCGEGGCGACVVLLSKYDPVCDKVEEFSVSSCLTLLCNINLCSITTTEGLGNSKNGFHSIHQRFAGFHASQCGFCTPGMCMSLFSALTNADKSSRPEPPEGFSKITKFESEKAVSGNLCRCTGYRPIADVCKSFAADVDLEDLGLNAFWKKGEEDVNVSRLPKYSQGQICTFPEFLKSEIKSSTDQTVEKSVYTNLPDCQWYRPTSFEELYEHLDSNALTDSQVKLVVGNTGSGVYKDYTLYEKYIDLKGIPELLEIKRENGGISFGAAVTVSRAIEVLKEQHESDLHSGGEAVFSKIADHMEKVASPFIRNMASLGGNLIMSQRYPFASDIATILLAAGSTVCLQMPSERLVLSLEEFLERPPCDNRTILISIHVPSWNSSVELSSEMNNYSVNGTKSKSKIKILFETYRAAPRPLGNAVSYLNAAFLAHVIPHEVSGDPVFHSLCLAFGAYGNEHAIRARKVEKFLVGKLLTASVLLEAIELLKKVIIPEVGTPHSSYRSSLAVAYLFKFLEPLVEELALTDKNLHADSSIVSSISNRSNGNANGHAEAFPDGASNFEQLSSPSVILSSEQLIECSKDYHPVGEPIKKAGAELQASGMLLIQILDSVSPQIAEVGFYNLQSLIRLLPLVQAQAYILTSLVIEPGEAVYVDDIPTPKDCLYGAFVYSTRALAHIKDITFDSPLASQKVIKFITSKDIPEGGKNVGFCFLSEDETLFPDSLTEFAGQPLGVVVAETQRYANMAAKQANVQYSTENLEPPLLTVEDSVRRSSFFDVPPFLAPTEVGDLSKGMAEADHKILSAEVKLGGQYYFYMETQSALAIPDEDNCIVVYSSIQTPELLQVAISKCLGVPEHNVRVITRRVGGGFGGKVSRSVIVAAACAVAAFKLQRPIKMYLDRQTDMIVVAGRHPMKVKYSVGFKADGKFTALHLDILIDSGISVDISPLMPGAVIGSLKKYNWGALSFDVKLCKTNFASRSAMRAPGDVQGSFIAEVIIENVASFLSMDADSVRIKNLHNYESLKLFYGKIAGDAPEYTLPAIVDELASSACYSDRRAAVCRFNSRNKWRKRGISWVPAVYIVKVRPTPGKVSILNDGSIVVEVGGVEIGQGLWTKVKQMAAFALGQLWDDRSQNLLDRTRIIQADTLSLIQGGWTGGSTTSESSCEAARLACCVLVSRLKPLKQSLEEQLGAAISWDTLISQAIMKSVNLSASIYWVPEDSSDGYLNYGAGMSEVEVDILTGATTILRSDLIYDCGQSLNPAVDLGQIEGSIVQGVGFFLYEERVQNSDGLVTSDGTWTYKIPTIDTVPKQFNVRVMKSGNHDKRVLSSKSSGEPPLLLAVSVHCAAREAIKSARAEFLDSGDASFFQFDVPATMPVMKELCGLDNVEKYLRSSVAAA